jgi:hypothetical protein
MYPTASIVKTITEDRLREAETGRRARRGADEQPARPRRPLGIRTLASRLAVSAPR